MHLAICRKKERVEKNSAIPISQQPSHHPYQTHANMLDPYPPASNPATTHTLTHEPHQKNSTTIAINYHQQTLNKKLAIKSQQ